MPELQRPRPVGVITDVEDFDADDTSALQHAANVQPCSAHVPVGVTGWIVAIVEQASSLLMVRSRNHHRQ